MRATTKRKAAPNLSEIRAGKTLAERRAEADTFKHPEGHLALPLAFLLDNRLSPVEYRIFEFVYYRMQQSSDRICRDSISDISAVLDIDRRATTKALTNLESEFSIYRIDAGIIFGDAYTVPEECPPPKRR